MGKLPGRSFAYKRDTDTSNIGPPPNLCPMQGTPPMGPLLRVILHIKFRLDRWEWLSESKSSIAAVALVPVLLEDDGISLDL